MVSRSAASCHSDWKGVLKTPSTGNMIISENVWCTYSSQMCACDKMLFLEYFGMESKSLKPNPCGWNKPGFQAKSNICYGTNLYLSFSPVNRVNDSRQSKNADPPKFALLVVMFRKSTMKCSNETNSFQRRMLTFREVSNLQRRFLATCETEKQRKLVLNISTMIYKLH